MFKYKGGESNEPVGLNFLVTDVQKQFVAVRRLVDWGTQWCSRA
jgi:hypothetical protein